jgi:tRNA 2-thiocytidine biosynthesis protein TtcA
MRRGILYRIAREQHCNVVALAQHLDDLAETLMMSMLFGGKLRTMSPHYLNDAGDLRLIRPFAYARERQTRAFAIDAGLPVISDNCPCCFAKPQQRQAMKQMLAEQEKAHPRIFNSLLTAMKPLMGEPPAPSMSNSPAA